MNSTSNQVTIQAPPQPTLNNFKYATFAAGCFWGVEKYFLNEFKGIQSSRVGYTGGSTQNPSYEEVCSGRSRHAEALQFEYNPNETPYKSLVEFFFRLHDPTTLNRQGNDTGTQYRSAIFYHDEEQKSIAEEVKEIVQKSHYPNQQVVTEIVPVEDFWIAEDYHQKYLLKNPSGYCNHRLRW